MESGRTLQQNFSKHRQFDFTSPLWKKKNALETNWKEPPVPSNTPLHANPCDGCLSRLPHQQLCLKTAVRPTCPCYLATLAVVQWLQPGLQDITGLLYIAKPRCAGSVVSEMAAAENAFAIDDVLLA